MSVSCNANISFFGYYVTWEPFTIQAPEEVRSLIINLSFYLTPIFLIVGTIGNVLAIIVFLRPAMSSLPSKNRFILISVMDILILYGCLLEMYLILNNYADFCNVEFEYFNIWIQLSLIMTDSWILALVTFERTLAIFRPLSMWTSNDERSRCCSWMNAIFIALPFVSLFLNLPSLFEPIIKVTIIVQFYYVLENINSVISSVVPFLLILLLDIAILIKLYGSPFSGLKNGGEKTKQKRNNGWLSRKKMRGAITKKTETPAGNIEDDMEADGDETDGSKKGKKKTGSGETLESSHVSVGRRSVRSRALQSLKMILASDMVAFLLNFPMVVVMISKTHVPIYVYVARLIFYSRHAINFFSYFIGPKFRRETLAVLRCFCCFRRPTTPGEISNTSLSTITSKIEI